MRQSKGRMKQKIESYAMDIRNVMGSCHETVMLWDAVTFVELGPCIVVVLKPSCRKTAMKHGQVT